MKLLSDCRTGTHETYSHEASAHEQQSGGAEPHDPTAAPAENTAAAAAFEDIAAQNMQMAGSQACHAEADGQEDGSSSSSRSSGSQHHGPPSPDREADVAAWLADHGQVLQPWLCYLSFLEQGEGGLARPHGKQDVKMPYLDQFRRPD